MGRSGDSPKRVPASLHRALADAAVSDSASRAAVVCWVLTQSWPREGEGLFGAYSTKAAAERARDEMPAKHRGEWHIYAVELDAAARWYGWDDREENKDDA